MLHATAGQKGDLLKSLRTQAEGATTTLNAVGDYAQELWRVSHLQPSAMA